jgi:hypothetical protein
MPADAVTFADGRAVRPSAKGQALPTAAAIGIDRPRGGLRSCRAHRLLPMTSHRQTIFADGLHMPSAKFKLFF